MSLNTTAESLEAEALDFLYQQGVIKDGKDGPQVALRTEKDLLVSVIDVPPSADDWEGHYLVTRKCARCDAEFTYQQPKGVMKAGGANARLYCSSNCTGNAQADNKRDRKQALKSGAIKSIIGTRRTEALALQSQVRAAQAVSTLRAHKAAALIAGMSEAGIDEAQLKQAFTVFVVEQLGQAQKVLAGKLEWSPAQVKLFQIVLDKCAANAGTQKLVNEEAMSDTAKRKLSEMSVQELESMLADTVEGETFDSDD